jgi:hypothetical protein
MKQNVKKVKGVYDSGNKNTGLFNKVILFFLSSMLFVFSVDAQEIKISAKVDERTELLSIIFRLAEAEEYSGNDFPVYIDKVNEYFTNYKDHKVVSFSQKMRKKHEVAYDAVMNMAVHLKIENGKISLIENIVQEKIDDRWQKDSIPKFLELLNDFYKETNFHDFFEQQKEIREITEQNFQYLINKIDFKWFESFFGEEPDENFNLIISLSNSGHYGPSVEFTNRKRDVFSIISVDETDNLGMPIFDDWTIETIIHEFCHSFCNKLIDKHYAEMKSKAKDFFKLQKPRMEFMAYGRPEIMLYETLVRACVIKYKESHGENEKTIIRQVRNQRYLGFMWIDKLFFELKEYDNNRNEYPTLDSFMPEIVKLQNSLNPKEMLKEQQEERSNTTIQIIGIENNSQNVDPILNKIIVKFDNPMIIGKNGMSEGKKGNWKKYGFTVLKAYWNEETKNEWILEVKLEPNKEYSVSFPWDFFFTEDVFPLKETYYLDFKTRE